MTKTMRRWGVLGNGMLMGTIVGCAPTVTVSRDDPTVEEGGSGGGGGSTNTGGIGGYGHTGGHGIAGYNPTDDQGIAGYNPTGDQGIAGYNPTGGQGIAGYSPTDPGIAGYDGSGGSGVAGYQGTDCSGIGGYAAVICSNANLGGNPGNAAGTGNTSGSACPCSRRPDHPLSMFCRRGADASVSKTVGHDGGKVSLPTPNVPFLIDVFGGSLDEDTELTLTELSTPPPEGFFDWSPIYEVTPLGLDFVNGGALEIPWENAPVSVPATLTIYFAEDPEGPWEPMPDALGNAGFMTATLLRSGYFFVGKRRTDDDVCP